MALEIEHKYLVTDDSYLSLCDKTRTMRISQGYLNRCPERTVRVRLTETAGSRIGFITIKGRTIDDTRAEYEYEIPAGDAARMIEMCEGNIIVKTRYIVPYHEHVWEVDIFEGKHAGLRIAEIELKEITHSYPLPPFAGKEVTGDPQYYNSAL